jgi:hypothetical protein
MLAQRRMSWPIRLAVDPVQDGLRQWLARCRSVAAVKGRPQAAPRTLTQPGHAHALSRERRRTANDPDPDGAMEGPSARWAAAIDTEHLARLRAGPETGRRQDAIGHGAMHVRPHPWTPHHHLAAGPQNFACSGATTGAPLPSAAVPGIHLAAALTQFVRLALNMPGGLATTERTPPARPCLTAMPERHGALVSTALVDHPFAASPAFSGPCLRAPKRAVMFRSKVPNPRPDAARRDEDT